MSDDLLATRRFKALTDEWTSEELGRFFWLAPEDMQEVRTCRGAALVEKGTQYVGRNCS